MQSRSEAATQTQAFAAIKPPHFIKVSLWRNPDSLLLSLLPSPLTLPCWLVEVNWLGGGAGLFSRLFMAVLFRCRASTPHPAARPWEGEAVKRKTPHRPPRFSYLHQSRVVKARPIRGCAPAAVWTEQRRRVAAGRGGGQVPQTTWLLIWRSIMRCNGIAALHECTHYSCIVSALQWSLCVRRLGQCSEPVSHI